MSTLAPEMGEEVMKALTRAAARAGRPSIVLLAKDIAGVDEITGSRSRTHKQIQHLEAAGRLRQVRRGAYAVASVTGVVDVDLLALVAVLTPRPYLVTAGRALSFHGLSDQHFRTAVVLSTRKLADWQWRGERTKYARVPAGRIWGGFDARLARRGRVRLASPARAILDSLAQPEWGVTLAQVTQALDLALGPDPDFAIELASQAARYGNASVSRRLGFLITRLYDHDVASPFLPLRGTTKGPILLSPAGPADGPTDRAWGIRENVDFAVLDDHRRGG